jgi:hypothetical protein
MHNKVYKFIKQKTVYYMKKESNNANTLFSNRLPLDVEADQLKGMIESMTGVDSKMVERLKKRLAIVELELSLNGC